MKEHIKHNYSKFKSLNWGEVITILAIMISVGGWALTRIDRQFDRIDRQFDRIEIKFDKIDDTLERIERDNRDFHGRLSNLEGKVECVK